LQVPAFQFPPAARHDEVLPGLVREQLPTLAVARSIGFPFA